jgi:competence protein ComEC
MRSMVQSAENPAIASDSPRVVARAALQHRLCRVAQRLSSGLDALERFLSQAGFDRAPWLAVAFAAGIATWFLLPAPSFWLAFITAMVGVAIVAVVALRPLGHFPYLRQAVASLSLVAAAGSGNRQ